MWRERELWAHTRALTGTEISRNCLRPPSIQVDSVDLWVVPPKVYVSLNVGEANIIVIPVV